MALQGQRCNFRFRVGNQTARSICLTWCRRADQQRLPPRLAAKAMGPLVGRAQAILGSG